MPEISYNKTMATYGQMESASAKLSDLARPPPWASFSASKSKPTTGTRRGVEMKTPSPSLPNVVLLVHGSSFVLNMSYSFLCTNFPQIRNSLGHHGLFQHWRLDHWFLSNCPRLECLAMYVDCHYRKRTRRYLLRSKRCARGQVAYRLPHHSKGLLGCPWVSIRRHPTGLPCMYLVFDSGLLGCAVRADSPYGHVPKFCEPRNPSRQRNDDDG